ncbi:hypothetical protein [Hymenobacter cavernae]|uniref:Uncharacterized protein n=1 Tax=Hymenobacter cavernae TaxID=2044852 RepID=A0ABQ1ULV9_9BACT|nr:hypothetical protein [Hymenobacter cavernae]GGF22195.1 hypothetical protein GCM10011383_37280 [Hymenobacter cavernae]
MSVLDILLGEGFDLAFTAQGDFAVGESDAQHVDLLLQTMQGEWREDALVGVGVTRYLKSPYGPAQASQLSREITIQLVRDGFTVLEVEVSDLTNASINAERL